MPDYLQKYFPSKEKKYSKCLNSDRAMNIWTSCTEEVVTSIHTPVRLPRCEYCTGFRTAKQKQTNKNQLYIHVKINKPHLTLIRCDNSYFLFGND